MSQTVTRTTAKRISDLKPNETVNLRFHGSKVYGNEPSTDEYTFLRFEGHGDDKRAIFDDGLEAYRYRGYWAYGTSAERVSIVKA